MLDSWELVNFAIALVNLVNSVLYLLTDKWFFFVGEFKLWGRVVKGLVKITHG